MAKSFGVNITGFDEVIGRYNKLLGDGLKPIINKCLEVAPKEINPKIEKDMQKHMKPQGGGTGETLRSMDRKNEITWVGTEATIPVGFHITNGGLASVFLMYGTARHYPNDGRKSGDSRYHSKPDDELREDIMGPATEKKIAEKQGEIFSKEIKKAFGE